MGDVVILKADYTVGNQTLEVLDYVTLEQTNNYGAIDFPVKKMDDELRADHRITVDANDPSLKYSHPSLKIDYTDESSAFHSVRYSINDRVTLGERSTYGKAVQKPGEVLWSTGITVSKGLLLFVAILSWLLVALWSYNQWGFLQEAYNRGDLTGFNPEFGILGKYIAFIIYMLFFGFGVVETRIQMLTGMNAVTGWMLKFIFTLFGVIAPVASFFFQFLIWFLLVQTLLDKK